MTNRKSFAPLSKSGNHLPVGSSAMESYDAPVSQDDILSVRVTPRSSRDQILGWQDGVLRLRLKAPPVDGRANEALCRYLAGVLGVPAGDVTVIGGQTSRMKRLRVLGLSVDEVKTRLGA